MVVGTLCNKGELMDQIIIKDIVVRGIIGVNESERSNPQDILINFINFFGYIISRNKR